MTGSSAAGIVGDIYATNEEKLAVATAEARLGAGVGGIPIGAALFSADGTLLGSGHNKRVQNDDAAMHAETNAFHNAGRQRSYRGTVMVSTLSPCWYCSGLVRQFGISRVVVGEDTTFKGGQDWLVENGVEVEIVNHPELITMMSEFIEANPALWNEDIGED
jgi:creatinine deaminase